MAVYIGLLSLTKSDPCSTCTHGIFFVRVSIHVIGVVIKNRVMDRATSHSLFLIYSMSFQNVFVHILGIG